MADSSNSRNAGCRCPRRFPADAPPPAAFTLVEMMVSLVVFSFIMLALVSGTIALERTFSAVDTYSTANGDEERVLDYICRDVRDSLSSQSPQVIVTGTPAGLQVTVPEYYISGSAVTPTVSGTTPAYGSTPITVTYALNGTTLTRQMGNDTAVVLSSNILSFTPVKDTTYDPSGNTIKITLTFNSTFQAAWSAAGTTLSTRVAIRP